MRTHIFVASVLIALIANGGAHAHAMLASASPPVGGSVGAAPRPGPRCFTQGLEPAFSARCKSPTARARASMPAKRKSAAAP